MGVGSRRLQHAGTRVMAVCAPRAPRVLLVYPRSSRHVLLSFEHMLPYFPGRRALMPPLGLMVFGASLPSSWPARLVDENVRLLSRGDLEWADVVAVSGMHPQRARIVEIVRQANSLGKLTIVGGPSASVAPDYYPEADLVHIGELGDGTSDMLAFVESIPVKPSRQIIFRTRQPTPLESQPLPALRLVDIHKYLVMPLQHSVGCPYHCEFCDIPVICGPRVRAKSGPRVVCELQALYDTGFVGAVSFVDDNLMGDRDALRQALPSIIQWQRQHRYPYPLHGEASLDLADELELLQALHDARFTDILLGLESLDERNLKMVAKRQNTRRPALDVIRTIQSYGIEVLLSLILGFDNDTEETAVRYTKFAQQAGATIVYLSPLCALPGTRLWGRMEAEGRLLAAADGDCKRGEEMLSSPTTNIRPKLSGQDVQAMLRQAVRALYAPNAVYRRLQWNAENVYGRQIPGLPPMRNAREIAKLLISTARALWRVMIGIGLHATERRPFWHFVAELMRLRWQGRIGHFPATLMRSAAIAHHLIQWGKTLAPAELERVRP